MINRPAFYLSKETQCQTFQSNFSERKLVTQTHKEHTKSQNVLDLLNKDPCQIINAGVNYIQHILNFC